MGETAKILSPYKKVLVPDKDAGARSRRPATSLGIIAKSWTYSYSYVNTTAAKALNM